MKKEIINAGFQIHDLKEDDIASSHRLPKHENHKDPFDRLIIWQCIKNNLTLISADERIEAYQKYGLKIVGRTIFN
ncbi:MAG: PIN domain-containing protein [Spirochaetota bacterium]